MLDSNSFYRDFTTPIEDQIQNLTQILYIRLINKLKGDSYIIEYAQPSKYAIGFSLGIVDKEAHNSYSNSFYERLSKGILRDSRIIKNFVPLALDVNFRYDPVSLQIKLSVDFQSIKYGNMGRKNDILNVQCPFRLNKGDDRLFIALLRNELFKKGVGRLTVRDETLQPAYSPFPPICLDVTTLNGVFEILPFQAEYTVSANSGGFLIACEDKRKMQFMPIVHGMDLQNQTLLIDNFIESIVEQIVKRFETDKTAFTLVTSAFEDVFNIMYDEQYKPLEIVF